MRMILCVALLECERKHHCESGDDDGYKEFNWEGSRI